LPVLIALAPAGCGAQSTAAEPPRITPAAVFSPSPAVGPSLSPAPFNPGLPNPRLTPGEVFPGITAVQVCVSGYASSVRNVTRDQYVAVYAAYGLPYPEPSGSYELDHLVPLELGGDNSDRNLWPEAASPAPGFHQKDELENYLHDAVCGGRMTLSDAQRGIAADWELLYQEYLKN
jgi:hypothetical protein